MILIINLLIILPTILLIGHFVTSLLNLISDLNFLINLLVINLINLNFLNFIILLNFLNSLNFLLIDLLNLLLKELDQDCYLQNQ